jgi:hypothetical protein
MRFKWHFLKTRLIKIERNINMAINYTTSYSKLIDERFRQNSITDKFAGKKYDFEGAQCVKVYSVDSVSLGDYNRTASGSRFGAVSELGDTVQTLTLTQDKAFTFSIDHGNAADQMNMKHCNTQLKSNWDEVCTPAIDQYRFSKWANGAGLGLLNTTALTKDTVISAIMTASAAMSEKLVPKKSRVLFINESIYILTKLSSEVIGIDTLGEKAVVSGVVGYIDGMAIVPVPSSYFPTTDINFIIKYKDATADPMKIKTMRVQKNPVGFDADIGECRFYHDSFVLDNKINGIYVHAKGGMAAAPTASGTSSITLATATSGAAIKYTTDGSNPKTSETAETYSSALTGLTSGTALRFYASKSGSVNSPVAEFAVA